MIDPDDLLFILMRAANIPDKSRVKKRTGEVIYTLRTKLTVYPEVRGEKPPLSVDGVFLVSHSGDINQITPDLLLLWEIEAGSLVDMLNIEWEEKDDS